MMDNQPPLTSPDGSSNGNPPERCPRSLYSRDSTQEDHTIPHHHQNKNLMDIKDEVKEEEETYVMGDQQFKEEVVMMGKVKEEESSPDVGSEGSSNGNPPGRCPRFLYSRDSTQEGHTIPHHHQGEERKDIKVEVKEEEEERLVSGDQQSMEEGCPLHSQNSIQKHQNYTENDQGEELKDIKPEIKEEEEERLVSGDQQSMEEEEMIMESKQEEPSLHVDTRWPLPLTCSPVVKRFGLASGTSSRLCDLSGSPSAKALARLQHPRHPYFYYKMFTFHVI
ncbi:uncharacterized protein [Aquarana catesbeiana]|uniref:uncharacterized protein n=1 Tax=Aquarana catesbeiana TaxID=8400 RepID=UPI003CC99497